MGVLTYTAASTAFIAKVRWNRVLLIGGGGSSGAATGTTSNSGGGAGGQSAQSRVPLAAGTSCTVAVGQAAAGSVTTNAVAGSDTTFNGSGTLAFRSQTHLSSNAGTFTPTEPAGAASGDILFYFVVYDAVSGGAITSEPTGGWTTIATWTGPTSGSVTKLYWIRRTGSAPGFTFSSVGAAYREAVVSAWSGAGGSGTPYVEQISAARTATTAPDCPAITTTTKNSIVIAFGMGWNGWVGTGGFTAPSGYSDGDGGNATGIANADVGVKYKAVATAGTSENPGIFGNYTASSTDDLAEATLELLTTTVVAKGGAGSALVSAGTTAGTGVAGSTTGGVGDTVRAGGNGGNGTAAGAQPGGGGGGAAGWTAAGSNASGGTLGAGNSPGGSGAAGQGTNTAGLAGSTPGGGGGGAQANTTTDRAGSGTSAGQAWIDWNPPAGLCNGMGVC